MKKILVPTDFSEPAQYAFDVAFDIAKRTNAEVHLINIIEPINYPDPAPLTGGNDYEDLEEVYVMKMMERIKDKMAQIREDHQEIKISEHVVVDEVFDGIENYAKENNIDMIVMGSAGSTGMDEILIGSNAEKVVRRSRQPVLVVKHKHENFDIKNIVFATNAEENTDRLVQTLKSIQQMFGAKMHLLNVNTPLNFYTTRSLTKMMENYAKKHELSNYTINVYNERTEEDGIIYFADENDADLIAMGTHGRTGLAHFFSGSIAEDVVNHSYRPILTFKLEERNKR